MVAGWVSNGKPCFDYRFILYTGLSKEEGLLQNCKRKQELPLQNKNNLVLYPIILNYDLID